MPIHKIIRPWDRRSRRRFDLHHEIHYKLLEDGKVIGSGVGVTLDISSTGVAFETEGRILPGTMLEISVGWPVLLDGNCLLRLVGCGQVVRSTAKMAACEIKKFDFRTRAKIAAVPKTRTAAA